MMALKGRRAAVLAIGLALAQPVRATEVPAVCPAFRDEATRALLAGPPSKWPASLAWASEPMQRAILQLRIGQAEGDAAMIEAARPVIQGWSNLNGGDPSFGTLLATSAEIKGEPAELAKAATLYERLMRRDGASGETVAKNLVGIRLRQARAVPLAEAVQYWTSAEQIIRKEQKRSGGDGSANDAWQNLADTLVFERALRQRDSAAADKVITRWRAHLAAEAEPFARVAIARRLAFDLVNRADRFDDEQRAPMLAEADRLLVVSAGRYAESSASQKLTAAISAPGQNLAGGWKANESECAEFARERGFKAWAAMLLAGTDSSKIAAARAELAAASGMFVAQPLHKQPPEFALKLAASLLDAAEGGAAAERPVLLAQARQALAEAERHAARCFCDAVRTDIAAEKVRLARLSAG